MQDSEVGGRSTTPVAGEWLTVTPDTARGIERLVAGYGNHVTTEQAALALAVGEIRAQRAARLAAEARVSVLRAERSLNRLFAEVREWQDATFTAATPANCAAHLRAEVAELVANPTDPAEIADCLMLVIGVANKAGVNLEAAVRAKLTVNRQRKWGDRNAEGFVEHVRTPAPSPGEVPE